MKKLLPVLILMFLACSTKAPQPQDAQNLQQALQLAQELNRPVLLDFMTDW